MTGSGECHIEQIQIIYDVLQMLVMVVIFIDASFHLFGTEIYRNQRQFVVRSFLRGTPDGVGFLQLPVAVWHDDMIEFQSLTLVDGDESDALDAVTMDAFFVEIVFPFLEKRLDVAAVVCQEGIQLVVEGTHVGTLHFHIFYLAKVKFRKQSFGQVE